MLKWEFLDRAATGGGEGGVRLRFRYSEELVRHVGLGRRGKRGKTRQGRRQKEDRVGREHRLGEFRVGTSPGHHRVGIHWKQAPTRRLGKDRITLEPSQHILNLSLCLPL